MKIDMHCHVSAGSLDSFISLKSTISVLKGKGFDGMVITDHNSYKGYDEELIGSIKDFTIILGIEYDTCDAGHILIILPSSIMSDCRFELRGMTLEKVSNIVRDLGGVLGVAHPYAHGKFGLAWHLARSTKGRSIADVLGLVDFVEAFNGTVPSPCNLKAKQLCFTHDMVGVAGSDSHRKSTTGLCGTIFTREIKNNSDLIEAILNNRVANIEEGYSKLSNSHVFRVLFNVAEWLYYWFHKVSCMRNKDINNGGECSYEAK